MPLITTRSNASARGLGGLITFGTSIPVDSDFESITTHAVTSATTSITFSSIAGTYKHLQIRGILLASNAYPEPKLKINGGGTANTYNTNFWYSANGADAVAGSDRASGFAVIGGNRGDTTYPHSFLINIPDYANTNKFKHGYIMSAMPKNNGDRIAYQAAFSHETTSAITSIEITVGVGNINANSHFALYGINA